MKALQGATKTAFLGFWISHIIFTIILDGQVVVPHLFPTVLRELLVWYCSLSNDPLISKATTPELLWFQALVSCELCFQLPFLIAAVRMLSSSLYTSTYPNWFRYACIAYGSHTATTMAPILATLITNPEATLPERVLITALYLPYLIFPLWILLLAVQDDSDKIESSPSKPKKS
jgi:hypothetical protein